MLVPAGLQYTWGPADPTLTPGHEYIVRVRAFDMRGAGGVAIANRGYSLPVRFAYGEVAGACPAPTGVRFNYVGQDDAELGWTPPPPLNGATVVGYTLGVRLAADANQAFTLKPSSAAATQQITNLSPATTFAFSLAARCADGSVSRAVGGEFDTNPALTANEDAGCAADYAAEQAAIVGTSELKKNDIYRFGDVLRVRAVEVTGSAATGYDGQGTLIIPFLEQGIIHVQFAGVKLTNGAATAGTLTPVRAENAPVFDPTQYVAFIGSSGCVDGSYASQSTDENGFYPDGKHYATGETVDPYGFDKTGKHVATGKNYAPVASNSDSKGGFDQDGRFVDSNGVATATFYDYNGCDREGFDEDGFPCGTQGWNGSQVYDEYTDHIAGELRDAATETADELLDDVIPQEVLDAAAIAVAVASGEDVDLASLVAQKIIDAVGFTDDTLAQSIVNLVGALEDKSEANNIVRNLLMPHELLYGEDYALLKEGMADKYFPDGLPEQLPTQGRDPDILAYENHVIRTYNGDRMLGFQRVKETVLDEWDSLDGYEFLEKVALGMIGKLNPAAIKTLIANPGNILELCKEAVATQLSKTATELANRAAAEKAAKKGSDGTSEGEDTG